jgi:hypothetical protein
MRRFELAEPQTLEEACALLSDDDDAKALAGGTALLTLIKHGIFIPKTLVNLKKIGGMSGIDYDRQRGLRIGALTRIYDVESSPVVRQYYPWLAEACHVVANIRIRNMATIGGNLAHGDYQSDPPTMLVALDASVELMRRDRHPPDEVIGIFAGQLRDCAGTGRVAFSARSSAAGQLARHLRQVHHRFFGREAMRRHRRTATHGARRMPRSAVGGGARFRPGRCVCTTRKNLRAAKKSLKPFCRRSAPKRATLSSP